MSNWAGQPGWEYDDDGPDEFGRPIQVSFCIACQFSTTSECERLDHDCLRCERCDAVITAGEQVFDLGDQEHLPPSKWRTWCSEDCLNDGEAAEQRTYRAYSGA